MRSTSVRRTSAVPIVTLSNSATAELIYSKTTTPYYVEDKLVLKFTSSTGVTSLTTLYDEAEGPNGPPPATQRILNTPSLTYDRTNDTFSVNYSVTFIDGQHDYPLYFPPDGVKSQTDVFDSAGQVVSTYEHDVNGFNDYRRYNTSGQKVYEYQRYDQDYGYTLAGTVIQGSYDTTTGKTVGYERDPDGSFSTIEDHIKGKSYAKQIAAYDNKGHLVYMIRYDSIDRQTFFQRMNSDGTGTVDNFDVYGRKTTSIVFAADGSRDVIFQDYFYTEGPPRSTTTLHYDANNHLATSIVAQADGTFRQTAFLTGEMLTSHAAISDTFTAASNGNDKFVFQPSFGQDLITNFHAGTEANHDLVDLSQLGIKLAPGTSTSDFIMAHSAPAGAGTVLTLASDEKITFQHVAYGSLKSENFLI